MRGGDLPKKLRNFGRKVKNRPQVQKFINKPHIQHFINLPRVRYFINKFKSPRPRAPLTDNTVSEASSATFHERWGEQPPQSEQASSGNSSKRTSHCDTPSPTPPHHWDPIGGTPIDRVSSVRSRATDLSYSRTPPHMRGGGPTTQLRKLTHRTKDGLRKVKERVGAKLLGAATRGYLSEASYASSPETPASTPRLREGPAKQPKIVIPEQKIDSKHPSIHSQQASIHSGFSPTESTQAARSESAPSQVADSFNVIGPTRRPTSSILERTHTFPPAAYPAYNERPGFIAGFLKRRFGSPFVIHERRTTSL